MKKHHLHFILLFALLFNIAHASIIAIEDDCHSESIHTYILEQSQSEDCGDICDSHHLFHFMAIVEGLKSAEYSAFSAPKLSYQIAIYTPPFTQIFAKPPIV